MTSTHSLGERAVPPLRAVRVFVVAARYLSLTRAAEALSVTQSAVSRRVRELEADLGVALFRRRGRNLQLTREGRAFADVAEDALARLQDEARRVRACNESSSITLSMPPSVAARWLAPRLRDFVAASPEIDLRISASLDLADLAREGIDGAIRYGPGGWAGVFATQLGEETLAPVCSPNLRDALGLCEPADLARATLLHGDRLPEDWNDWFRAAGIGNVRSARGPHFSDANALLRAATDGVGVALGRSILTQEELNSGKLVEPFSTRIRASYSYWFVVPIDRRDEVRLSRIREWLLEQFAASTAGGHR